MVGWRANQPRRDNGEVLDDGVHPGAAKPEERQRVTIINNSNWRNYMKNGYTDISIVLDRSGSMESVKSDTIGGFNAFLDDQKKAGGEATITLAQFDDVYEVLYFALPIVDAKRLDSATFVPRGSTALLDAIGRTIHDTGKRLEAMPEGERPEKVIFVIVTDGEENASKEFTAAQVNDLITHQREKYNWEFVFLGANQDAITTAANLGIAGAASLTYAANSKGVQGAYASLSRSVTSRRAGITMGVDFSDEDRDTQKKAGVRQSK